MKVTNYLRKLLYFDDFMKIFLIIFGLGYVVVLFGNLREVSNIGILNYLFLMVGLFVGEILFLKVYQWVCRKVGFDKMYYKVFGKK